MLLGSHVSFSKEEQLLGSVKEAISYGANTFMIYTGAPQNTNRMPIDELLTEKAYELIKEKEISNIIAHAPYIINPANKLNTDFCIGFLVGELKRCEQLRIDRLVLHPGSHVGFGVDAGIENIIYVLNESLGQSKTIICLETMAGKGSEIGSSFNELKRIIDGVKDKSKIMVCMDTCHMSDSGYDITDFSKLLDEFDKIIGLNKLGCIHINDSKNESLSHKDRHANIGFGTLGFDNIISIIYNEKLKDIPKILETPYISDGRNSYPPYKAEIEMIKNKKINMHLEEDIRTYYK